MHEAYGGVVPELASRDHIQRVVPLAQRVLAEAGSTLHDLDGIAYTQGPGLAGALLVGAAVANALGFALGEAGRRRPSPRRPSALAAARGSEAGVSVRRAARVRRPQPVVRRRRRRPLSAARRHAGRCGGRSVRQDGEAARASLSGRARACAIGGVGARRRSVAAAADARQRRSRHELQRAQDRGARRSRGGTQATER